MNRSHVYRFSAIIALLFIFKWSFAQTYTFTKLQETYQNLVNPISINKGEYWDDFSYFGIPFNINFKFYNQTYDSLFIGSSSISFNLEIGDIIDFSGQEIGVFSTYVDLKDRGDVTSQSPIGYTITGATGSRIFKLEWRNAGLVDDEPGTNFVNIQLWLYEGSNIIEIRYGSSLVNNLGIYFPGANGPLVGFYNDDPTKGYYLRGNPNNPTLSTTPPFPALSGAPPNGTVYRFTPSTSSVRTLQEAGYSIYPNPFTNQLRIDYPTAMQTGKLRLIDMTGRIVSTQVFNTNEAIQLPTEKLSAGGYLLEVQVNDQRLQSKVIKME